MAAFLCLETHCWCDAVVGSRLTAGVQTTNCSRFGGNKLTVNGINFGSSGASVYIGSESCLQTVHTIGKEDVQLTCTLPKGNALSLPVVVLQANGGLSSGALCAHFSALMLFTGQASLGYHQCPAGSFEVLLECFACPSGLKLVVCVLADFCFRFQAITPMHRVSNLAIRVQKEVIPPVLVPFSVKPVRAVAFSLVKGPRNASRVHRALLLGLLGKQFVNRVHLVNFRLRRQLSAVICALSTRKRCLLASSPCAGAMPTRKQANLPVWRAAGCSLRKATVSTACFLSFLLMLV